MWDSDKRRDLNPEVARADKGVMWSETRFLSVPHMFDSKRASWI